MTEAMLMASCACCPGALAVTAGAIQCDSVPNTLHCRIHENKLQQLYPIQVVISLLILHVQTIHSVYVDWMDPRSGRYHSILRTSWSRGQRHASSCLCQWCRNHGYRGRCHVSQFACHCCGSWQSRLCCQRHGRNPSPQRPLIPTTVAGVWHPSMEHEFCLSLLRLCHVIWLCCHGLTRAHAASGHWPT